MYGANCVIYHFPCWRQSDAKQGKHCNFYCICYIILFFLPISILEFSSEKLYIDILKSLKEVSLHYVNKFYILSFLNSRKPTCVCITKLHTKIWYSKPKMFKQHAYCCLIMNLNCFV